jgi:hypothetical protein
MLQNWRIKRSGAAMTVQHSAGRLTAVVKVENNVAYQRNGAEHRLVSGMTPDKLRTAIHASGDL